jgi:hypothetical protein
MTIAEQAKFILDPKKLKLPDRPPIEAIEVEEIYDWEGERALRVQLILSDDTTDEDLTGTSGLQLNLAVREGAISLVRVIRR